MEKIEPLAWRERLAVIPPRWIGLAAARRRRSFVLRELEGTGGAAGGRRLLLERRFYPGTLTKRRKYPPTCVLG